MKWCDLFGLPGVGKSTVCDPIEQPRIDKHQRVDPPPEWGEFIQCVRRLLPLTDWHPTARIARQAISTAIRVTAAVHADDRPGVVVHRCFAHRGLSLGCRMRDPEPIRDFYRLMPVSVGVAHFVADLDTIRKRNTDRGDDKFWMAELMQRPIEIALEEFAKRSVPLVMIDTMKPVEESRATLLAFAEN